jgi:hypothetical protein
VIRILLLAVLLLAGVRPSTASQDQETLWPNGAEIEHFLKKAKITERVKIGTGVTKPEKATLELDGETRHAIFKKVDKKHDNWRYEVAAYHLDKLLGLGMVPPTVERNVGGRKGCLQLWVTGVTMQKYEDTPPDIEAWRRQISIMWLFDDLIGNIDRHLNNAMVSPDYRLMLIDNSKSFGSLRRLLNDLNGAGTGTHARFWMTPFDKDRQRYPTNYSHSQDFLGRIRGLTKKQLKKGIGRYIWGYNRGLILKRQQMIVERLNEMGTAVMVQSRLR